MTTIICFNIFRTFIPYLNLIFDLIITFYIKSTSAEFLRLSPSKAIKSIISPRRIFTTSKSSLFLYCVRKSSTILIKSVLLISDDIALKSSFVFTIISFCFLQKFSRSSPLKNTTVHKNFVGYVYCSLFPTTCRDFCLVFFQNYHLHPTTAISNYEQK